MTEAEILTAIEAVAHEHLGHHGRLALEMRLVEDLRLDSIRLLTLAVEVENRFRVRLDEADDEQIQTVGDLVRVVDRKLAEKPSEAAPEAASTNAPPRPAPGGG